MKFCKYLSLYICGVVVAQLGFAAFREVPPGVNVDAVFTIGGEAGDVDRPLDHVNARSGEHYPPINCVGLQNGYCRLDLNRNGKSLETIPRRNGLTCIVWVGKS